MLVTRCPNCDTSFRVTEDQLAIASGAVRCGACLQVFAAYEHMVAEPVADDVALAEPEELDADLELPETDQAVFDEDDGVPPEMLNPAVAPEEDAWFDGADEDDWPDAQETLNEGADPEGQAREGEAPLILLDDMDEESFSGELNIETDPALIVGEPTPERAKVFWGWKVGVAVLIIALPLQVAWFKRYEFATYEALGDYYDAACQYLPCGLPEYSDLSQLKATDLVVRSHPEVDRALRIDAIIINQADVRQVFPDVEIRFANMNNRLLAARVFKPKEYLKGELTGLKYIPARTEVRISLELVDPGPDATNYSLNLY